MKILVVGSTSTLALALKERLTRSHTVHLAGRRRADVHVDLADWARDVDLPSRYDVVVHAAADFGGAEPIDLVRAEAVNAAGTLAVCRLAQRGGARRFVLISTAFATLGENDPFFGIYALSKRHGEEGAALFCRQYAMGLVVLRPTQIYDAAGRCRRHQAFLYMAADHAERGEDIVIFGEHDPRRNYVFLDDATEVIARAVDRDVTGTYLCAHPESPRLSEVAEAALKAFGRGGRVRFDASRTGVPSLPAMTDTRIYRLVDYEPVVDISKGMELIRDSRRSVASR
jgi:nucleoside-diphosphate-sugar epimerase